MKTQILVALSLLLLATMATALPSYTQEDETQGLSDFAQFRDSLSGQVELTDLKLGVIEDIDVRVRRLTHPATGRTVKGVCLLIPAGENSRLILVRYIDADELGQVLEAMADFENRMNTTEPEPDMRAYYMTRGRIGIGVKYYGKWKGIVKTDGITRTFGDGDFRNLREKLQEASRLLN